MTKKDTKSARELRHRAEEEASLEEALPLQPPSPEEVPILLNELRVHQIELEMQVEELRNKQRELDASRARYFNLYDLAPISYLTVNEKGLILEGNLTAATMLGVVRHVLLQNVLSKFIFIQDQDAYFLHRRRHTETGDAQNWEMRMVRADGSLFWAHLQMTTPEHNDECLITFTDITERKQIEEESIRQSSLLNTLFDSIPEMIFLKDLRGTYLGCNPPFAEFVGRSSREIVGKTDYDLFDQGMADFFREQDDLMMKRGEPRTNEEWITYPDGCKILVETLKAPYHDLEGRQIGLLGITRNITKRKYQELELLKSRENYLRIFENQMTAICVFDVETLQIVDVNDTFVRLYGYSREELLVDTKATDLNADKELAVEAIRSHKTLESFSIPLRYHLKKDGTIFPVEIVGSTYIRDDRLVMYDMIHDISPRKHAEEELRKIHSELERKVRERTADLEKTNATLAMMLDYARKTEADIQERVVANLRSNILGIVNTLRKQPLAKDTQDLVELLETTTLNLAHPIARNLESQLLKLTTREIQLANFIRLGKSTKELVELLDISKKTVETHRDNLRKKLGIHNKKINLRTYLNSEFTK